MLNELNTPAIHITLDEIAEILISANSSGLSFQTLSTHLYNNRRNCFGQEPSLRQVHGALKKFLTQHEAYFTKDKDGLYALREAPPTQLYFEFDKDEDAHQTLLHDDEPKVQNIVQLEFDF